MYFQRMTSENHPAFLVAMDLYEASFPDYDIRIRSSQLAAMQDSDYHCMAIYEQEKVIGIFFYWETVDFKYLEHFAIDPRYRGKQYGSKALSMFCQGEKRVLLEIEPPIDKVAQKRLAFYERLGFYLQPYTHMHPPFRREGKAYDLKVMVYKENILEEVYTQFFSYIFNHVMQYADTKIVDTTFF